MQHEYKGWIIERSEAGHFNMRPANEDFWTDAAELLREAKAMIDRLPDLQMHAHPSLRTVTETTLEPERRTFS